MIKPVRVRTIWFKKDGERSAEEIATAVATTTWRVADKAVTRFRLYSPAQLKPNR